MQNAVEIQRATPTKKTQNRASLFGKSEQQLLLYIPVSAKQAAAILFKKLPA